MIVAIILIASSFIFKGQTSVMKRECKSIYKQCIKDIRKNEVKNIERCLQERAICLKNKNSRSICKKEARSCILKSMEEKSNGNKECKVQYKNCILKGYDRIRK